MTSIDYSGKIGPSETSMNGPTLGPVMSRSDERSDDPARGARLSDLGATFAWMGQRDDAEATATEAVNVYRRLADANPAAFGPDLASSLNNLSFLLAGLGRREDALAAITEAVTIRRELAARWPDVHRYELEQSLQLAAWLEHEEDRSDAFPPEPKQR